MDDELKLEGVIFDANKNNEIPVRELE